MSISSIGDLAQHLVLRNRSSQIRSEITELTQELASGHVSDVSSHLNGEYSHLADIHHNLGRNEALSVTAAETGVFAATMQRSLETLDNRVADLTQSLVAIGNFGQQINREQASLQAENELKAMIGAINHSVAGRSLFSGTATDQVSLRSAEMILQELRTVVGPGTTAIDVVQAATDWFADPAGFNTTIYQGSDQSLAPFQVGKNDHVSIDLRADNPVFHDVLKNTALAALATDPALSLDQVERTELLKLAGSGLTNSKDDIVGLRANIGYVEDRIGKAEARNSAVKTSLEFAREELIGADPFDVSVRLQSVQSQLQNLYTVTARTSSLTLVNFLR